MSTDVSTLRDLFRAYPGRSMALSVLPVVLAGAQSVNALVHDVSSPVVAAFIVVLLAFAVGATRHSLASFRTESLESQFFEDYPDGRD